MKKVIISVALLVTFLTSSCFALWTDNAWKDEAGQDLLGRYLDENSTIKPEIDLSVKKATDADFSNSLALVEEFPGIDLKATLDMSTVEQKFNTIIENAAIYAEGKTNKDQLLTDLETIPVKGLFTIEIQYPTASVEAASVEAIKNASNLSGFVSDGLDLYEEVSRDMTNVGTNWTKLTIVVKTKDLTVAQIRNKLKDITFYAQDVQLSQNYNANKVTVKLSGKTWIGGDAAIANNTVTDSAAVINYEAAGEIPIVISKRGGSRRPSTGSGSTGDNTGDNKGDNTGDVGESNIVVSIPGTEGTSVTVKTGETVKAEELPVPEAREGYAFGGYYTDMYYENKVPEEIKVDKDMAVYGRWINLNAPEDLNSEDHVAYIQGYPDGNVKPFNNITREEIATIFYRIMKASKGEAIYAETNNFTDVENGRWSNIAISTMAKGGYLTGYPDGSFNPSGNITRAEFATIIARFTSSLVETGTPYNDIAGHWAEKYILTAEANRWLDGHAEKDFRPDEYITRADVISIINSVLVRYVGEAGLIDGYNIFTDNDKSSEYYYEIIEATTAHDQEREEDKYNEQWKKINN